MELAIVLDVIWLPAGNNNAACAVSGPLLPAAPPAWMPGSEDGCKYPLVVMAATFLVRTVVSD